MGPFYRQVGPAGEVGVFWLASNEDDGLWNAYYTSSSDQGASFPGSECITCGRRAGEGWQEPTGFESPFGDYGGMCIDSEGTVHAVWGEGWEDISDGATYYARR
jgi:hypothetical protein